MLIFILGYGFVHFETEEAALNAIQKVNGMLLNGKKVFVGRFVPRKEREVELGEKARRFTNVYIKNINEEYDEGRLTEMFEKYGKISSVKVIAIRKKLLTYFLCYKDLRNVCGHNWHFNFYILICFDI